MKKRKIYKILSRLSPEEMDAFNLWVSQSNHTNRGEKETVKVLAEFYPKFLNTQSIEELIGTKFKEFDIDQTFYKLVLEVKKYLHQQRYNADPVNQSFNLIQSLQERGLISEFELELKRFQKTLRSAKVSSVEKRYWKFRIDDLLHEHLVTHDKRVSDVGLNKSSLSLDRFFEIQKLAYLCSGITRERIMNVEIPIRYKEEVLQNLDAQLAEEDADLRLWKDAYTLCNGEGGMKVYRRFKESLDKQKHISSKELANLYVIQARSVSNVFKPGTSKFYQELFDNYQASEKRALLLFANVLPPALFNNICTVGIKIGEFDWLLKFIKKYKNYLPEENRSAYLNLAVARIRFQTNKFEIARKMAMDSQAIDIDLKLGAKRLILKASFELKDWQFLESQLNTFKVYLHREKKLSEIHIKLHKTFYQAMRKAWKTFSHPDHIELEALRTFCSGEKRLIDRDWFVSKMEEAK